jgi:hypothetical protein
VKARFVVDRRGPGFAPRRGFTVTDTRTGDVVEPATLDANGVPVSRWTRDRAQRRARELNDAAGQAAEPTCCGVPMVHNSFTGEYECADAYFLLVDEGALGEPGHGDLNPELLTDEDVPPNLLAALQHWRASRRPGRTD